MKKVSARDYENDLARRLHAAAIARGKARARLDRMSNGGEPAAFRLRALHDVILTSTAWLKIYFEAVEHFRKEAEDVQKQTAA